MPSKKLLSSCKLQWIALGVLAMPGLLWAQSLPDLWEKMLASDPTLLGAVAQTRAMAERVNQTYAQLLPKLNLTSNTTYNYRTYSTFGELPTVNKDRFNSHGMQISLSQAIWKKADSINHDQSKAQSEQAIQQLQATKQEMLLKLVTIWIEALYSRDAVRAAHAVEALSNRLALTYEQGYALGLYSVSQRDEGRSKLQQAIAERYTAESEQYIRHSALEQLTGQIPSLREDVLSIQTQRLPYALVSSVQELVDNLEETNPSILAAQQALRVARHEVNKQQAAHLPTLDLTAGLGKNSQTATGNIPGQFGYKNRTDNIAFQLNIPLYSGGGQSSKVREAINLEVKAIYEVELAKRNAGTSVQQSWAQLRSAQARLEAAEKALTLGYSLEKLAVAGQKNGNKTPADELDARRMIEIALRDARRAYYDNVLGMSRLLAASGLFEEYSLIDIQHRMLNPSLFNVIPAVVYAQSENVEVFAGGGVFSDPRFNLKIAP